MTKDASVRHSEAQTVPANEIDIVYDTFGDDSDPPMLLVMGLSTQMIGWHEEFCRQPSARGYWVIRFDNRDVGLSTKFDEAGVPDLMAIVRAMQTGEAAGLSAPYTLRDMADDAVGLLDALHVDSAHVVGVSMGGMIAQMMAIHYPERVRTLTSIMSTTGDPGLPPPKAEALPALLEAPPADRKAYIEHSRRIWRVLWGPGFAFDEDYVRERAGRAYDRSFYPAGGARQLAAVLASGSRKEALQSVTAPALVIHGRADPLVPVEGGIDTAEAVPEAELMIIEGMGHSLPPQTWPQIIEAIDGHAST
jgi:pimeloyl-ACP methyl ester carboxylesterase